MHQFLEKITDTINFNNFEDVFVGFSGGPDSTALLYSLKQISREMKFNLQAVHFEHGIRGESSLSDLRWAENFCHENKISFLSFRLDVLNNMRKGEGVEEAARRLRLEQWFKLGKNDKTAIALGQHLDDKIENFFIRLFRGSNTSGLTSLKHSVCMNNVYFIRPLLNFSKDEIISYLFENKISFVTDETNHESIYRRNIIRNEILPAVYKKIPTSKKALTTSINALSIDAEFIDLTAKNEFDKIKDIQILELEFLKSLHESVLIRLLRLWISTVLKCDYVPSSSFFRRFKKELSKIEPSERLIPLTGIAFYVSMKNGTISIKDKPVKRHLDKTVRWNWRENSIIKFGNYELKAKIIKNEFDVKILTNKNEIAVFDIEDLPKNLLLRTKNDGDRLTPFRSETSVRLKKILKNKKIDTEKRPELPILTMTDDNILWVPYVIRSNFATIKETTPEIVLFEISQLKC